MAKLFDDKDICPSISNGSLIRYHFLGEKELAYWLTNIKSDPCIQPISRQQVSELKPGTIVIDGVWKGDNFCPRKISKLSNLDIQKCKDFLEKFIF